MLAVSNISSQWPLHRPILPALRHHPRTKNLVQRGSCEHGERDSGAVVGDGDGEVKSAGGGGGDANHGEVLLSSMVVVNGSCASAAGACAGDDYYDDDDDDEERLIPLLPVTMLAMVRRSLLLVWVVGVLLALQLLQLVSVMTMVVVAVITFAREKNTTDDERKLYRLSSFGRGRRDVVFREECLLPRYGEGFRCLHRRSLVQVRRHVQLPPSVFSLFYASSPQHP